MTPAALRGTVASMLVHVGILAAVLWAGGANVRFGTADTLGAEDLEAGGGGGGGAAEEQVVYVDIAPAVAPPPPAVQPDPSELLFPDSTPPPPPDTLAAPPAEEEPSSRPSDLPRLLGDVAAVGGGAGAGSGGGQGDGAGTGVGGGSGSGSGGGMGSGIGTGTGEGSGGSGDVVPPFPEGLFIPPLPAPPGLRGRTLPVRFSIDERGRVREVAFDSGNRGYDRLLRREAMEWRFRPARNRSGQPIAVQYDVPITF